MSRIFTTTPHPRRCCSPSQTCLVPSAIYQVLDQLGSWRIRILDRLLRGGWGHEQPLRGRALGSRTTASRPPLVVLVPIPIQVQAATSRPPAPVLVLVRVLVRITLFAETRRYNRENLGLQQRQMTKRHESIKLKVRRSTWNYITKRK